MTVNIEWSQEAIRTFNHALTQISEKWTEKEVENFIERTQQVVNFISQNPVMYPYSEKGLVHRAVITKQTSLYYHIPNEGRVVLLSFEDS